jgi:hypothetical protein
LPHFHYVGISMGGLFGVAACAKAPHAGCFREEPDAGNSPARICEDESRMAQLLDRDPQTLIFR